MEELTAGAIDSLIGVSAEIVALRLQQVSRQARGAISVEEGESGAHTGKRKREQGSLGDEVPPPLSLALISAAK